MSSKTTYFCDRCKNEIPKTVTWEYLVFGKEQYIFCRMRMAYREIEMMLCPNCRKSLEQWMANYDGPQG